jgi:3-hydroxyisobutyrate dehydrogenase-like beta-hydroxyacid dehydrogenase
MSEAVGFIGLGNMGEPIAGNILRAGFPLKVFNRTASKAAGLTAQGAKLAASAAEVAERGGIVCTMLADDRAVEEICGGEDSFVKRLGQGGVHLSMSTIAPATARQLAAQHKKYGVEYVASPVFGRPEAAAAAKLFVCVAGSALAKKNVEPILKTIAQGIFDFGEDPGSANVVKLCGNFLVASTVAALAEMLILAEKNGVSKKAMAEMIGKFSPLHHSYASMMAEGRFEPAGFRLALGLKDINLVLETAAASVTPLPIASLLHDRWLASMAKGRANLDWSAVILDVAENAGIHAAVGASSAARS